MKQARVPYPSDLTDEEWDIIQPLLPNKRTGRPREVDLREVLNAIFYLLRSGCAWRMLPHDLPAWETVYWYFASWKDDGTIERINDELRKKVRIQAGRKPEPTAGIADSQSVKTTEKGGSRVTMVANKPREESAISWLTPWV